jgi:predicted RNase H-like HicB family nuclease
MVFVRCAAVGRAGIESAERVLDVAAYELEVVVTELPATGEYMSRYLAEVPAQQGCWVEADTIEEALEEIREAARLFVRSYWQRNDPLPDGLRELPGGPLPLRVRVPVAVP